MNGVCIYSIVFIIDNWALLGLLLLFGVERRQGRARQVEVWLVESFFFFGNGVGSDGFMTIIYPFQMIQ